MFRNIVLLSGLIETSDSIVFFLEGKISRQRQSARQSVYIFTAALSGLFRQFAYYYL